MTDKEPDGLVVPKFSSFKSKPPIQTPKDSAEGKSSSKRTRDEKTYRISHRDEKRHRKTEDQRRPESKQADKSHTASEAAPSKSAYFIIDTKGDPLIRKYGGSDKWSLLRFRRYGKGRILGTEGRLLIEYEGSRQVFSILRPGQGLYSSKHREGLRARHSIVSKRNIRLKRTKSNNEEDDGYISVGNSRKLKVDDSSEDDSKTSYRSIHGKAKVEDDMESASDDDGSEYDDSQQNNDPLRQKTMMLNREVKEHPENIEAWMQLIDHQDMLMHAGRERELLSENERHSYGEVRVDLLESALRHAQLPQDRDRIILMLMREGPKVWSTKVSARRWKELESSALSHDLWKLRLQFAMCDISTFQHTTIKTMFLERLKELLGSQSSMQSLSVFQECIDVFLRMTRFLYDCGYKELAISAWQAMIELVFFRPDIEHSAVRIPTIFSDFWESEAPRIGENDATGWNQFVSSNGLIDPPEPANAPNPEIHTSRDVFKAWGLLEHKMSEISRHPARTLDAGTEMDPYRVVMFADIEPLLFYIPSSMIPELSSQLIGSLLIFCGFPSLISDNPYLQSARDDPTLSVLHLPHEPFFQFADGEDMEKRKVHTARSMIRAELSPSLILGSANWFSALDAPSQLSNLDSLRLMRILQELSRSVSDTQLAMYSLGLVSILTPLSTKKAAKALLKKYPQEARLYIGYSLAEYSQNHVEAADKILYAAMASTQVNIRFVLSGSIFILTHSQLLNGSHGSRLISTAVYIKLDVGELLTAKQILCSVGATLQGSHSAEPSTNDILKAEQSYQAGFETGMIAKNWDNALENAECLVLLRYLTVQGSVEPMSSSQGNISAAMDNVRDVLGNFRGDDLATAPVEAFIQSAVKLLYTHARNG